MKKIYIKIEGMMCNYCYETISKIIQKDFNVKKVKIKRDIATILYENEINIENIIEEINRFMPCGPLQAMQIYALSTASIFYGAISMFLFCLGTIPLMLFFGSFINLCKGKAKVIINKIASVLILILSILMLNRALVGFGIDINSIFLKTENAQYVKAIQEDGYQYIEFDLDYGNYKDIIVQKDVPVKLIINVDKKYLTGCNNEIIMKDFKIDQKLDIGTNEIEFTPQEEGEYIYSCWMNMIKNKIKVIDNKDYFKEEN